MLLIALKYFVERKLAGRRAFDRTFRELSHTTDRELADMGLARGDVTPISREAKRDAEAKVAQKQAQALAKKHALADLNPPPRAYF